ncbi:MAG: FliA/WhiG family RNA polymerase sigma factor [Phycisphaerales bacterium]|nr:MAG: FliA/WhiG family RNA polymerase sigma factor [Phycisphaerales bacterium]
MRATKARTDLAAVWRKFKRSGAKRWRNALMEGYLPIVRYNAERIGTKLPDEVDHDDLVSAGVFGLIDALEAFDVNRGVKFETYCAPRIRGAILDELRSMDWVPRLVRSRSGKLERVTRELEATLGWTPSETEIAERLKLPRGELEKLLRDANAISQISLSRKCNETDSNKDVCEIDVIEDKRGENPVREIHKKDIKEVMMRGLTRAERLILILYYYEEMTMKEIGMTLDLSESRVSQMHSSILERLKAQLDTRQKDLVH